MSECELYRGGHDFSSVFYDKNGDAVEIKKEWKENLGSYNAVSRNCFRKCRRCGFMKRIGTWDTSLPWGIHNG